LIPRDYFFWAEYTIDPIAQQAALTDYVESEKQLTPELVTRMGSQILKHPFTEYFLSGGADESLKLSDFLTRTQLDNSEIYSTVYRQWGFKHNLSGSISASLGKAAGIGLCDSKKDFTERDRLLLNLFRGHFDQAHRNAKLATTRGAATRPLAAYGLTPRETETAHWLAGGKSNPEIALILGCSARTIEKHVERILEKIGVENRVIAATVITQASARP
jgi:DNA-binding CsgD family transcriptional regulator